MDSKYWHDKWRSNDIGFNREAPHAALVRHFPKGAKGKVMVPLCGKSVDMTWLRAQGLEVVGVELSPIACEAFFAENHIPMAPRAEGPFQVFEGGGYTLWCGDFFVLPEKAWVGCTFLYDRAALVALPPHLRRRYAQTICGRFRGGTMLLVALSYGGPESLGPPFSVTEDEVRGLYGTSFRVELLEAAVDPAVRRADRFQGVEITEAVYRLHEKS